MCFAVSCHVTLRDVMGCFACMCLDVVECMLARVYMVGVHLYACLRLRTYMCLTTRAACVFYLLIGRFVLAVAGLFAMVGDALRMRSVVYQQLIHVCVTRAQHVTSHAQ